MNVSSVNLTITALPGIPLIQPGDDLPQVILDALNRAQVMLQDGDVLVVTSKIVSKAEGRFVPLVDVMPGPEAEHLASVTGKDPRVVELVLRESCHVSRHGPGVLVTEHRLGFISANAGIDQSNIGDADERVLLLPLDPDQSAQNIRRVLHESTGVEIGVVISDSHGRPFRLGNVGVAVGVAGIPALRDMRGDVDMFGRTLQITIQGYADLIASAAQLVSGEGAEGRPVTLLRGLDFAPAVGRAADLYRPAEKDLYR